MGAKQLRLQLFIIIADGSYLHIYGLEAEGADENYCNHDDKVSPFITAPPLGWYQGFSLGLLLLIVIASLELENVIIRFLQVRVRLFVPMDLAIGIVARSA